MASVSEVGSTPTPNPSEFRPKPANYSVAEVFLAFLKEKVKDVSKAGAYLSFWAMQAIPDLPKSVSKYNTTLRDFKNFISTTEVPQKLYEMSGSIMQLTSNATDAINGAAEATWLKVGFAARKVFKDSTSAVNALADSIEFSKLFIPISKETLRWITAINFAATTGYAGNGVIEQVENIIKNQDCDQKKNTLYMLNLARDISYLALGVIGLTFLATCTPLAPWMIVACTTSGLAFTIGGYFYEKIVDPENKGKNLNPAIVVENLVAQRAYEESLNVPASA